MKSLISEPVVGVLNRITTKPDRKMIIKCYLSKHKMTSLKVKVTLTLKNGCVLGPGYF